MGFWRKTVVVAPDDGMCKATTPAVKQSRASQWRARASHRLGSSADMVNGFYAFLNLRLRLPKKNLKNVYGDWWFHTNNFDSHSANTVS